MIGWQQCWDGHWHLFDVQAQVRREQARANPVPVTSSCGAQTIDTLLVSVAGLDNDGTIPLEACGSCARDSVERGFKPSELEDPEAALDAVPKGE